jgi:flagellar basal-body rod protein FlgB
MNFTDVPLMSILREKMSWLNARHAVLAQNIANEDVPGYPAQDLKPLDFESVLHDATQPGKVGLTVTNPMHIAPPDSGSDPYVQIDTAGSKGAHSPSAVSDEEEMMKVSDTQAQYQAAANLYAKSIQMMRTAIDR